MGLSNKKEILTDAGVDVDGVLQRFMNNEALAERFLKKFPDDATFGKLEEAIDAGDYEEAFKEVHTLKGVAGNLGLTRLFACASDMTEKLRRNETDTARDDFKEMKAVYNALISAIGDSLGNGMER